MPLFKWKFHTNYVLFYLLYEKNRKAFQFLGVLGKCLGGFCAWLKFQRFDPWLQLDHSEMWRHSTNRWPRGPVFVSPKTEFQYFVFQISISFEMLCKRRNQKNLREKFIVTRAILILKSRCHPAVFRHEKNYAVKRQFYCPTRWNT